MSTHRKWLLPLALGLITALLLGATLWPKPNPYLTVLVAARDLGAGQALTAADLVEQRLPVAVAPTDGVTDPARLVGQTLAVVRFAGEPITPRHLGQTVTLHPTERALAVKVKADTGLAGLLRPGMQVGVIATLPTQEQNDLYAKTVLEGLRVLYVSPDFQARPYAPATASATVNTSKSSPSGALGLDSSPPVTAAGNSGTVKEGVLVLAVSTLAQPLRYETITATAKLGGGVIATAPLTTTLTTTGKKVEPAVKWFVPVELLAALNRADSLTLVLLPQQPQVYTSAGLNLRDVAPAQPEVRP
jgi:hypothetical protein